MSRKFMFAMMASGGDLGSAIAPQLVRSITDAITLSNFGINLASSLGISPEQLGMKAGMLLGMIFPLIAIFVYLTIIRNYKKDNLLQ